MKKLFLIIFLIPLLGHTQEDKKPIKLETKLKNEEKQKVTNTFIPVDNSAKFKVDPKEVTEINSLDTKALQEKVDAMRNRVFDAKSKLIETTKDEAAANAPLSYLTMQHKNKMSARFNILSLTYILDGKRVYSGYDLFRTKKDIYPVFNEYVAPGHHEIFVEMVCSGSEDSAFNYLKDYRIKVQNRYAFVIPNTKRMVLDVSSFESGSIFTSFKDRPTFKFESNIENKIPENKGK